MRVTGVLLAGGRSSRMGSPKALLPLAGETFLARTLRTLEAGGIDDIVIVTGLHDAEIRQARADVPLVAGTRVVFNAAHEQGQLSSLLAGLDALAPHHPDAILVALVDQPLVRASTVVRIVAEFHRDPAPVVRPVFGGRRGHPVLFARETFADLRAAPPGEGARAVVRALGDRVRDIEVDDPGVIFDVDTPGDYERALRFAQEA
jgi:CTP:molybdopterin cytidylyltransferase MocA